MINLDIGDMLIFKGGIVNCIMSACKCELGRVYFCLVNVKKLDMKLSTHNVQNSQ
jgi:hypothetical protein